MTAPRRVLVVGGGMAGTMAGLAAREAGAEVSLVMAGPGASALSNGVLDVAWPDELATLRARAGHPLHVLRDSLSSLPEVLAWSAMRLAPLFEQRASLADGLHATVLGTLRPAGVVQRAQAAGKLERDKRYAIAGFPLLPGLIDAELIAQSLSAASFPAEGCRVDYLDRNEDIALTAYDLAARLDDSAQVDRLAAALVRSLPRGCDRLLLPPVLGLARSDVAEQLAIKVGLPVAELLPTAPSVPGLRLSRALAAARETGGLRLIEGGLARIREGQAQLVSGQIEPFDAAVLATGRYLGGGLARRGTTTEPLARLPVSDGRHALPDESGPGVMAGETLGAAAALFRAGVETDATLRVLDSERRPQRWLHAAGAILAGADGAVDGTGLGFAAFTGWLAGRHAAG